MNTPEPITRLPEGGTHTVLGGSHFVCKLSGADTGGTYALIAYTAAPGAGSSAHIHHYEDESFYILSGSLTFQLADTTFVATPGALVFIPKGLPHAFANQTAEPVQALITVSPAGLEAYFGTLGALIEANPADIGAQIAALNQRYGLVFFEPTVE